MLLLWQFLTYLGYITCLENFILRQLNLLFLYCDNANTTYMASNPVNHARPKNLELDIYFVQKKVQARPLVV